MLKDITVLMSASSSPSMPGMIRCLRNNGERSIKVVGIDMTSDPSAKFMVDAFYQVPAANDPIFCDLVLDICKREKKTIIFVTHDIEEAVYLADRIVVMTPNPGKVKGVIKVPLHHFRDRTSGDFLLVRDKIFDLLNMKNEDAIEYNI